MSNDTIIIGTRKSALALWQSNHVAESIREQNPGIEVKLLHINTVGDVTQESGRPLPEIGGKGLFTAELEEALDNNSIDIAVHSLKDLPTEMSDNFTIAAISQRVECSDVLISRGKCKFIDLPQGATVGTSSLRRSAQLKRIRPDINTESIRGNVDTRIKKVEAENSPYHAIVMAHAGLLRLGLQDKVSEILDMLPAPGQGALGIQTRSNDKRVIDIVSRLNHAPTQICVTIERDFLSGLNAGCSTPVAAYAYITGSKVCFTGRVLSEDGRQCVEVNETMEAGQSESLGRRMAEAAISQGALILLKKNV